MCACAAAPGGLPAPRNVQKGERPMPIQDLLVGSTGFVGGNLLAKHAFAAARPSSDIAESYADPSKAAKELGWNAEYDIEEMCRDQWNWQSKNPNGYDAK